MISSKFPKSFRGAYDLVVFHGMMPTRFMVFVVIFGFFWLCKVHQAPPFHQHPLNSSESCLKSPDGVMIKFWKRSKNSFFYGPCPNYDLPYSNKKFSAVTIQTTTFRATFQLPLTKKSTAVRRENPNSKMNLRNVPFISCLLNLASPGGLSLSSFWSSWSLLVHATSGTRRSKKTVSFNLPAGNTQAWTEFWQFF